MGSIDNPVQGLAKFIGSNPSVSDHDPPVHGVVSALELQPDTVVVELGAGLGHYTIPIAHRLDRLGGDGLIFGLDVAHSLLLQLEEMRDRYDLDRRMRVMSIRSIDRDCLPIQDASVDRVLAVNALHYLADPLPGYMEIARILKPGGFALLVDWRKRGVRPPPGSSPVATSINSVALDLLATGMLVPGAVALRGYAFAVRAVKRSSEPLRS